MGLLFPIYIYIWKVIEVMFQTTKQLKDMAVLKSNFAGTFGAKLLEPIQSFRATFSRREPTKLEMSGCRAWFGQISHIFNVEIKDVDQWWSVMIIVDQWWSAFITDVEWFWMILDKLVHLNARHIRWENPEPPFNTKKGSWLHDLLEDAVPLISG